MEVIKLRNDTVNVDESGSQSCLKLYTCFTTDRRRCIGGLLFTIDFDCVRYNIVPVRFSVQYKAIKAKVIRYALFLSLCCSFPVPA